MRTRIVFAVFAAWALPIQITLVTGSVFVCAIGSVIPPWGDQKRLLDVAWTVKQITIQISGSYWGDIPTAQVRRVCAGQREEQDTHTSTHHAGRHAVVYRPSLKEHFDGLEGNDEADHREHRELAVHVPHGDVGEVHLC